MKKSIVPVMCLIVLISLLNGCGGGKYSELRKLNQKYITLMETYINDIDKANNAKSVAKAMNRFADGLEIIWPRMKKLSEKYPEIKNNPPEELKASQKEAEAVGMKIGSAFRKIMPYMENSNVKKAQARLSAIMK